jgi:hypothetical protein
MYPDIFTAIPKEPALEAEFFDRICDRNSILVSKRAMLAICGKTRSLRFMRAGSNLG